MSDLILGTGEETTVRFGPGGRAYSFSGRGDAEELFDKCERSIRTEIEGLERLLASRPRWFVTRYKDGEVVSDE